MGSVSIDTLNISNVKIGSVVKSSSHCDYVVQVDDAMAVTSPPSPDDYGFGSFVKLCNGDPSELGAPNRPPIVGIIYNSQLFNPAVLGNGPRLSSEADPLFTPDLINETRTLLGVVLIGSLETRETPPTPYGDQGIPREVVPVNTPTYRMTTAEIKAFHYTNQGKPQFRYYSLLLRYGGSFADHLAEQILEELVSLRLFDSQEQRALEMLCKELTWRNTMGTLR